MTEEQLHGLLEDCELTESWIQNLEMNENTPSEALLSKDASLLGLNKIFQ